MSSFHTVKVLKSAVQRSWQRRELHVETVPAAEFLVRRRGSLEILLWDKMVALTLTRFLSVYALQF